jgi:pimeloyl-ACP methyl ester carboxylesterase
VEALRRLRRPDGVSLCYGVTPAARRAPGRAVLLLHGLASNKSRYAEFVAHTTLTARFDVLRVDLRGHGDSPARGPLSLELWCDDLAAILDAEAHPRAIVVGHSLGAQVALAFGARYPDRTAGLALIDPVFRPALRGKWRRIAQLAPLFRAAAALVRLANALGLRRRHVEPYDLQRLDELARAALASPAGSAEFVRRYSSACEDLRHFRTAHYLQELVEMFRPPPPLAALGMPVLVLLSTGGTFADAATMAQLLAQLPRAQTVAIDCQHWPLTERPFEVRTAIERWCEAIC